jgi:hypothetical protein
VILHSRADDVIPFADSEELVMNSGSPASSLIEVGSDHRLADRSHWRQCLERARMPKTSRSILSAILNLPSENGRPEMLSHRRVPRFRLMSNEAAWRLLQPSRTLCNLQPVSALRFRQMKCSEGFQVCGFFFQRTKGKLEFPHCPAEADKEQG